MGGHGHLDRRDGQVRDRVRADVDEGGRLQRLSIDPDLMGAGADAVAEAMVQAVQAAQAEAGRQAASVLNGLTPGGDAAATAQAGLQRLDSIMADLEGLTRRLANS